MIDINLLRIRRVKLYQYMIVLLLCVSTIACENTEKKISPSVLVRTTVIKVKPYHQHIFLRGIITGQFLPTITAKVDARVVKIFVDEGDKVKQGELLILLDNKESLVKKNSAVAAVRSAKAKYMALLKEKQLKEKLSSKGLIAKIDYIKISTETKEAREELSAINEALKKAEIDLSRTKIVAPIDGEIAKVYVNIGEFVQVFYKTKLVTLVNPDTITAAFPISQAMVKAISPGQKIIISVIGSNLLLVSRITRVSPSIDIETGYFKALVTFKNKYKWKIGRSVKGTIYTYKENKTVTLPKTAVILKDNGYVVYVIKNDKAIEKKVQIVARLKNDMVVIGDFIDGMTVAILGGSNIEDGDKVREVKK